MTDIQKRWWQRIQWIKVVSVVIGVVFLLFLTMELSIRHYGPE